MTTRTDALADAHERLDGYAYLDGPGFAVHGPMGAETLSTLGHDDLVAGWIETYKARYQPIDAPPAKDRLAPHDESSWRPALGDPARVSDWASLFRAALGDQTWQTVLERWLPILLPGHGGAFTHGLLRVAHGVRALPTDGPPPQTLLDELAKGLALWAATFTTLPGRPQLQGSLTLPAAIARLPRPDLQWPMFEAGTLTRISELDRFPDTVEALGPPDAIDHALSDLTTAFCRTLLAHPDVFTQPLVHTVTPTAAIRILLPHLPGAAVEVVYAQLWHVNAAIISAFTTRPTPEDPQQWDDANVPAPDDILARATEHRDTHALKFAEACTREHTLRPDPAYLLAAQHVIDQLPPW